MTRENMIAAIEGEIARLEQVRDLLRSSTSRRFSAPAPERTTESKKPRVLSAEARRRIAQAQKRRWARQRKDSAAPLQDS